MLQETAQTADALPDWLKIVSLVASSNFVTGFVTFLLTRPKTQSDIAKNSADAHKSEADAIGRNVETIVSLNDELGDVLVDMRRLRKEVEELEDLRDTLSDTIETINQGFKSEKSLIVIVVNKAIADLDDLINNLISREIGQGFRVKLVVILEALYTIKKKLTD